ncbi:MAG: F0F1 ATP synthase subunit gamma [Desulfosarcina sp.]|nr:F0F1 ATP synthase subunit gamma [Desulfosarcina sp.]MBC2764684.1 ATP F0F1 synthase subunit gamma [Desulfosarcina sp.]
MPSLKDVQLKIQGVKKTKQITKAMNMVATSRLRGAQGAMDGFRPYAEKFSEVLGSLAEKAGEEASPLLIPKEEVKKIHMVLCTSDRGLCGGFNINLTDGAKNHIKNNPIEGAEYSFTCFGKKGRGWCLKEQHAIADAHLGVVGSKFGFSVASTAGKKLVDGFLDGQYDEVYIIYSEFVSMAKQLPVVQKLLPIPPIEKDESDEGFSEEYQAEHICEPSPEALLGDPDGYCRRRRGPQRLKHILGGCKWHRILVKSRRLWDLSWTWSLNRGSCRISLLRF